jgi:hypothetical protein
MNITGGTVNVIPAFVYVFFGRIIGSLERNVCALADL